LAERGLCKPEVRGSSPLASTKLSCDSDGKVPRGDATEGAERATNADRANRLVDWPPEVEHSKQFSD
jgi:hypothetical protein